MNDASDRSESLGDTGVIELTGKIMVVALILLFFVVVFVFCLHLYAKWFWYRRHDNSTSAAATGRRRRFDFAAGHREVTVTALHPGLEPSILKTLPVVLFDPRQFKDGLECAVCLCEVSEGEKARLLPKCNHGFHLECIDMWFQSHSTCPLCRNPVSDPNQLSSGGGEAAVESTVRRDPSLEAVNFPTNVLIWGDETQVSTLGPRVEEDNHQGGSNAAAVAEPSSSSSSSSVGLRGNRPDGISVIDIPRQVNEEDELKSPVPTRLRSLKRLLSGHRRVNNLPSPRNVDIEQGGGGQS